MDIIGRYGRVLPSITLLQLRVQHLCTDNGSILGYGRIIRHDIGSRQLVTCTIRPPFVPSESNDWRPSRVAAAAMPSVALPAPIANQVTV